MLKNVQREHYVKRVRPWDQCGRIVEVRDTNVPTVLRRGLSGVLIDVDSEDLTGLRLQLPGHGISGRNA